MSTCKTKTMSGQTCGNPAFSDASELCEMHFSHKYPATHFRLKNEVRCPACSGFGYRNVSDPATNITRQEVCAKCSGRKWVNERT